MTTPLEMCHLNEQIERIRAIRPRLELSAEQRIVWLETLQERDMSAEMLICCVDKYLRESPREYPTPALLREYAREISSNILSRISEPNAPSGLTPEAYIEWLRGWRRQVIEENLQPSARVDDFMFTEVNSAPVLSMGMSQALTQEPVQSGISHQNWGWGN